MTPGISADHQAGILRAVHACLIHNTLLNAPSIETRVHCDADVEARYNPV